jgi:Tfp pilus assembly protein PilO
MLAPDSEVESMTPSPNTVETIAHQLDDLPAKQPAPEKEQQDAQQHAKRHTTRTKPRYKDLAVNLNDLSAAADRLGLQLPKGKGYQSLLQQVLGAIVSNSSYPPQPSPVDADALPQTLAPLLQQMATLQQQFQNLQAGRESIALLEREVVTLRDQLHQVTQERDSLQAQTDQVVSLQHECDQLKTQLHSANDRLNQFLRLAQGAPPIPTPQATTTTLPTEAPLPQPAPVAPHQPDSQSQNAQPSQQQPKRKPKASTKVSPEERIALAVQALMHHNQQCTHPKDRWFISGNTIASITHTNPATKVKPWLDSHPDVAHAIDQHNQDMGTTNPHHNRGKEKEELREIYEAFQNTQLL